MKTSVSTRHLDTYKSPPEFSNKAVSNWEGMIETAGIEDKFNQVEYQPEREER